MNEKKERLTEMLSEVTAELKTVGIHNPQNQEDWVPVPENLDAEEPDDNVAADAVESWNERSALVATLEARYNSVVHALERIDAGTYGTCEICARPIEEDRLNANPAARTCIEHKEEESTL